MTPTEMEEAIRNLQLQWTRIEQFLPNLATRAELVATRAELVAQIQDAKRHAVILNEATRDQIKLLAENLARVEATMATKEELRSAIDGVEQKLRAAIGGVEGELRAVIVGVEGELRAVIVGVEEELKGAIGGLERTLSRQVSQLASQIATLAKRRKK